ncbi:MAG: transglutaminase domain-containing protein [Filifactoraceae bacterium]
MEKIVKFLGKLIFISIVSLVVIMYNLNYISAESKIIKIDTTNNFVDPLMVIIDLDKLHFDYDNLYSDNQFSRLNRIIKQAVNSSEDEIFIRLKSFNDSDMEKFHEVFEDVMLYNGYSFKSYYTKYIKDKNGVYNVTFKIDYRETLEERKKVDEWIKTQINSYVLPLKTSVEKINKINEIITKTITYDNSLINNTAYQGVYKGTTVCDGYAVLGHRMLLAAGFKDVLTVGGFGINAGKSPVEHRWNMIRLDGQWYHIDFTFNDNGSDVTRFLLKKDDLMSENHMWDKKKYPISD